MRYEDIHNAVETARIQGDFRLEQRALILLHERGHMNSLNRPARRTIEWLVRRYIVDTREIGGRTMYKIESQGRLPSPRVGFDGNWSDEYIGDDNRFETEAEAEAAIESLRELGDEWADAPYRVVDTD